MRLGCLKTRQLSWPSPEEWNREEKAECGKTITKTEREQERLVSPVGG